MECGIYLPFMVKKSENGRLMGTDENDKSRQLMENGKSNKIWVNLLSKI